MLSSRTNPNKMPTLKERVFYNIVHARRMFEEARKGAAYSRYTDCAVQIVDLVRFSENNSQLLNAVKEAGAMIHHPYMPKNVREIYMHARIEAAIHKKSSCNVQEYIFDSCFGNIGNHGLTDSEVLLLFILKTKAEANNVRPASLNKHFVYMMDAILLKDHLRREEIDEKIMRRKDNRVR